MKSATCGVGEIAVRGEEDHPTISAERLPQPSGEGCRADLVPVEEDPPLPIQADDELVPPQGRSQHPRHRWNLDGVTHLTWPVATAP